VNGGGKFLEVQKKYFKIVKNNKRYLPTHISIGQ